jgi:hypothetical protein
MSWLNLVSPATLDIYQVTPNSCEARVEEDPKNNLLRVDDILKG